MTSQATEHDVKDVFDTTQTTPDALVPNSSEFVAQSTSFCTVDSLLNSADQSESNSDTTAVFNQQNTNATLGNEFDIDVINPSPSSSEAFEVVDISSKNNTNADDAIAQSNSVSDDLLNLLGSSTMNKPGGEVPSLQQSSGQLIASGSFIPVNNRLFKNNHITTSETTDLSALVTLESQPVASNLPSTENLLGISNPSGSLVPIEPMVEKKELVTTKVKQVDGFESTFSTDPSLLSSFAKTEANKAQQIKVGLYEEESSISVPYAQAMTTLHEKLFQSTDVHKAVDESLFNDGNCEHQSSTDKLIPSFVPVSTTSVPNVFNVSIIDGDCTADSSVENTDDLLSIQDTSAILTNGFMQSVVSSEAQVNSQPINDLGDSNNDLICADEPAALVSTVKENVNNTQYESKNVLSPEVNQIISENISDLGRKENETSVFLSSVVSEVPQTSVCCVYTTPLKDTSNDPNSNFLGALTKEPVKDETPPPIAPIRRKKAKQISEKTKSSAGSKHQVRETLQSNGILNEATDNTESLMITKSSELLSNNPSAENSILSSSSNKYASTGLDIFADSPAVGDSNNPFAEDSVLDANFNETEPNELNIFTDSPFGRDTNIPLAEDSTLDNKSNNTAATGLDIFTDSPATGDSNNPPAEDSTLDDKSNNKGETGLDIFTNTPVSGDGNKPPAEDSVFDDNSKKAELDIFTDSLFGRDTSNPLAEDSLLDANSKETPPSELDIFTDSPFGRDTSNPLAEDSVLAANSKETPPSELDIFTDSPVIGDTNNPFTEDSVFDTNCNETEPNELEIFTDSPFGRDTSNPLAEESVLDVSSKETAPTELDVFTDSAAVGDIKNPPAEDSTLDDKFSNTTATGLDNFADTPVIGDANNLSAEDSSLDDKSNSTAATELDIFPDSPAIGDTNKPPAEHITLDDKSNKTAATGLDIFTDSPFGRETSNPHVEDSVLDASFNESAPTELDAFTDSPVNGDANNPPAEDSVLDDKSNKTAATGLEIFIDSPFDRDTSNPPAEDSVLDVSFKETAATGLDVFTDSPLNGDANSPPAEDSTLDDKFSNTTATGLDNFADTPVSVDANILSAEDSSLDDKSNSTAATELDIFSDSPCIGDINKPLAEYITLDDKSSNTVATELDIFTHSPAIGDSNNPLAEDSAFDANFKETEPNELHIFPDIAVSGDIDNPPAEDNVLDANCNKTAQTGLDIFNDSPAIGGSNNPLAEDSVLDANFKETETNELVIFPNSAVVRDTNKPLAEDSTLDDKSSNTVATELDVFTDSPAVGDANNPPAEDTIFDSNFKAAPPSELDIFTDSPAIGDSNNPLCKDSVLDANFNETAPTELDVFTDSPVNGDANNPSAEDSTLDDKSNNTAATGLDFFSNTPVSDDANKPPAAGSVFDENSNKSAQTGLDIFTDSPAIGDSNNLLAEDSVLDANFKKPELNELHLFSDSAVSGDTSNPPAEDSVLDANFNETAPTELDVFTDSPVNGDANNPSAEDSTLDDKSNNTAATGLDFFSNTPVSDDANKPPAAGSVFDENSNKSAQTGLDIFTDSPAIGDSNNLLAEDSVLDANFKKPELNELHLFSDSAVSGDTSNPPAEDSVLDANSKEAEPNECDTFPDSAVISDTNNPPAEDSILDANPTEAPPSELDIFTDSPATGDSNNSLAEDSVLDANFKETEPNNFDIFPDSAVVGGTNKPPAKDSTLDDKSINTVATGLDIFPDSAVIFDTNKQPAEDIIFDANTKEVPPSELEIFTVYPAVGESNNLLAENSVLDAKFNETEANELNIFPDSPINGDSNNPPVEDSILHASSNKSSPTELEIITDSPVVYDCNSPTVENDSFVASSNNTNESCPLSNIVPISADSLSVIESNASKDTTLLQSYSFKLEELNPSKVMDMEFQVLVEKAPNENIPDKDEVLLKTHLSESEILQDTEGLQFNVNSTKFSSIEVLNAPGSPILSSESSAKDILIESYNEQTKVSKVVSATPLKSELFSPEPPLCSNIKGENTNSLNDLRDVSNKSFTRSFDQKNIDEDIQIPNSSLSSTVPPVTSRHLKESKKVDELSCSDDNSVFDSDYINVSDITSSDDESGPKQYDTISQVSLEFDDNPFSCALPAPPPRSRKKFKETNPSTNQWPENVSSLKVIPSTVYIDDEMKEDSPTDETQLSPDNEFFGNETFTPTSYVNYSEDIELNQSEEFMPFDIGWDEIQQLKPSIEVMPVIAEVSEPEEEDSASDINDVSLFPVSTCDNPILSEEKEETSYTFNASDTDKQQPKELTEALNEGNTGATQPVTIITLNHSLANVLSQMSENEKNPQIEMEKSATDSLSLKVNPSVAETESTNSTFSSEDNDESQFKPKIDEDNDPDVSTIKVILNFVLDNVCAVMTEERETRDGTCSICHEPEPINEDPVHDLNDSNFEESMYSLTEVTGLSILKKSTETKDLSNSDTLLGTDYSDHEPFTNMDVSSKIGYKNFYHAEEEVEKFEKLNEQAVGNVHLNNVTMNTMTVGVTANQDKISEMEELKSNFTELEEFNCVNSELTVDREIGATNERSILEHCEAKLANTDTAHNLMEGFLLPAQSSTKFSEIAKPFKHTEGRASENTENLSENKHTDQDTKEASQPISISSVLTDTFDVPKVEGSSNLTNEHKIEMGKMQPIEKLLRAEAENNECFENIDNHSNETVTHLEVPLHVKIDVGTSDSAQQKSKAELELSGDLSDSAHISDLELSISKEPTPDGGFQKSLPLKSSETDISNLLEEQLLEDDKPNSSVIYEISFAEDGVKEDILNEPKLMSNTRSNDDAQHNNINVIVESTPHRDDKEGHNTSDVPQAALHSKASYQIDLDKNKEQSIVFAPETTQNQEQLKDKKPHLENASIATVFEAPKAVLLPLKDPDGNDTPTLKKKLVLDLHTPDEYDESTEILPSTTTRTRYDTIGSLDMLSDSEEELDNMLSPTKSEVSSVDALASLDSGKEDALSDVSPLNSSATKRRRSLVPPSSLVLSVALDDLQGKGMTTISSDETKLEIVNEARVSFDADLPTENQSIADRLGEIYTKAQPANANSSTNTQMNERKDSTRLSLPQPTPPSNIKRPITWEIVVIGGVDYKVDATAIQPFKRVISHGGFYKEKNTIVEIFARYLPESNIPNYTWVIDNLFLYLLSTMELLVQDKEFVIVFFNNSVSKSHFPSTAWLKKSHSYLPHFLRKNIKGFYIVQSSFYLKTVIGLTRMFINRKAFKKLKNVKSHVELKPFIPIDFLFVPEEITRNYAQSKSAQESGKVTSLWRRLLNY